MYLCFIFLRINQSVVSLLTSFNRSEVHPVARFLVFVFALRNGKRDRAALGLDSREGSCLRCAGIAVRSSNVFLYIILQCRRGAPAGNKESRHLLGRQWGYWTEQSR